jgi:hypothetical protein
MIGLTMKQLIQTLQSTYSYNSMIKNHLFAYAVITPELLDCRELGFYGKEVLRLMTDLL